MKVPRNVISKAIENNGPLPIALAIHLSQHDLVTNPGFYDSVRRRINSPDLYSGNDWPIVLELFHVQEGGMLNVNWPLEGSLLQKPFADEVSMIRYDAFPEVFYEDREDRGDFDPDDFEFPDHAIEDFTSSYDDDDDDDDDDDGFYDADDEEPY